MKTGRKDILLFESLLDRAELVESSSREARRHAIKSQERVLKRLLRELGLISAWAAIFAALMYLMKNIKLFMAVNKVLAVSTAVAVTTASAVSVKYYVASKKEKQAVSEISIPEPVETETEQVNIPPRIKMKLIGFQGFTSETIGSAELSALNRAAARVLGSGSQTRVIQSAGMHSNAEYIVLGSAESEDGAVLLTSRIVRGDTSEVVGIVRKSLRKDEGFEERCRDYFREIKAKLN